MEYAYYTPEGVAKWRGVELLKEDENRVVFRKGACEIFRVNNVSFTIKPVSPADFEDNKIIISSIGVGKSVTKYNVTVTRLNDTDVEVLIDKESPYFDKDKSMFVMIYAVPYKIGEKLVDKGDRSEEYYSPVKLIFE